MESNWSGEALTAGSDMMILTAGTMVGWSVGISLYDGVHSSNKARLYNFTTTT